VPVPFDTKHVLYVWVDALCNYISGLKEVNSDSFEKFWPADVHIIGKDISWFHTVIWPALLLSAGFPLPRHVLIHGWWTVDGDKMSKTKGNVIDPFEMAEKYGSDVFRFYVMYNAHISSDSNFSLLELKTQNNAILANNMGNLVSRVVTLINQYSNGIIPRVTKLEADDERLIEMIKNTQNYTSAMKEFTVRNALLDLIEKFSELNKYITVQKPWDDFKNGNREQGEKTLALLAESIRFLSLELEPFIPTKAREIRVILGASNEDHHFLLENSRGNKVLAEKRILFSKID
jgi:methionyl-tRNA synthetase